MKLIIKMKTEHLKNNGSFKILIETIIVDIILKI